MKQVIIFSNCDQNFALDIARIERIIEYTTPKKVPETAEFLKGVIPYNGQVLPIIDLNRRLYGVNAQDSEKAKVIVISWNGTFLGLMVDEVLGIRNLEETAFEDAALGDGRLSREYVRGFIKIGEDLIIHLDTDRLFDFRQTEEILALDTPQ